MEKEGPGWDQGKRLVVTLPNGTTKTVAISQGAQKRYWFGICPISSKIGNLKMCSCCKIVGYVGKEEQVNFLTQLTQMKFFSETWLGLDLSF